MKYAKMLGLLAVAAASLMAFAGSASATTPTAPAGISYTGHIEATSELGHVILHASNGVTIECGGTATGELTAHGSGATTASGPITALTFPGCTGGDVVTVLKNAEGKLLTGTLEAHTIAGGATLTSNGATIEAVDGATGIPCEYTTTNTHIGVVTNAPGATGHATLDINSAKITRTGGSILCGSTATWTGNYKVNTPTGLIFD